MEISPVILEGRHVRLEPLSPMHAESLIDASGDGELWNSTVTIVPSRANIAAYIAAALDARARGLALPFVIIRKPSGQVVGSTRYFHIERDHRRLEIGYTWLSASAQRTAVNTEAKLSLLTHAFDRLGCIRVEFVTDVLNQQSRAAILRLGAKQEGVLRNHNGDARRPLPRFSLLQHHRRRVAGGKSSARVEAQGRSIRKLPNLQKLRRRGIPADNQLAHKLITVNWRRLSPSTA